MPCRALVSMDVYAILGYAFYAGGGCILRWRGMLSRAHFSFDDDVSDGDPLTSI